MACEFTWRFIHLAPFSQPSFHNVKPRMLVEMLLLDWPKIAF
jgi:hypothetical protein